MDNLTTGDGKPLFQSTLNDEAGDLQSHSSSYNLYLIDEANCYSDCSDIHGDICRGDENAPLAFIVFISEPVLQERLEYLKAHTSELHKPHSVFRAFSECRVDGPLALPYALCLVKTLRQHAGQQLLMNRLNDTILLLSTRLRGLLTTHLLYTHRDRISRAALLLQRPVFYKRSDLPGNFWQESTVSGFSLDGLTVTLLLSNYRILKVLAATGKRKK
ncbi:FluG domain protein, 2nd best blastp hit to FluG [Histoplasma ohiense]|nr:FluG domain protein, 2nd best blastp hit to FluG [Histoplasma ohiense (nom. inval.)]